MGPPNLVALIAGSLYLSSSTPAARGRRACRGNQGVVPIMFFFLAASIASLGPGNISTAALLAPMAMNTASRSGIPLLLMAIMVGSLYQAASTMNSELLAGHWLIVVGQSPPPITITNQVIAPTTLINYGFNPVDISQVIISI